MCGVYFPPDLGDAIVGAGRNKEIDLFCPMPASFVDLSLCDCARALIMHLERQVAGQQPESALVKYRFEPMEEGPAMQYRKNECRIGTAAMASST